VTTESVILITTNIIVVVKLNFKFTFTTGLYDSALAPMNLRYIELRYF